jgi:hypothetical protein
MTTYVQARTAVVSLINTAWVTQYPTIPIIYENTLAVDLDTVGDMLLRINIDFDDAQQMTVNGSPHHMIMGTVRMMIMWREGKGTVSALEVMDFLTNLTKFKLNTPVTFWLPTPGRKVAQKGWVSQNLDLPFRFHTMGI